MAQSFNNPFARRPQPQEDYTADAIKMSGQMVELEEDITLTFKKGMLVASEMHFFRDGSRFLKLFIKPDILLKEHNGKTD